MPEALFLASFGACAGLLAGILGIGGGIILVPALIFLFEAKNFPPEMVTQLAVGTSLASIIFTGSAGSWMHHRNRNVDWRIVWAMAPFILIGTQFGAFLAVTMHGQTLKKLFGLFEFFVAARMMKPLKISSQAKDYQGDISRADLPGDPQGVVEIGPGAQDPNERQKSSLEETYVHGAPLGGGNGNHGVPLGATAESRPSSPDPIYIYIAGGVAVGTVSSLFGIGGGTLSVPIIAFLLGRPLKTAIGTSSAQGVVIAISGTAAFIYQGWKAPQLPAGMFGYVDLKAALLIALASLFTAPLGAVLAHRIQPATLSRLFGILLVFVGLKLIGLF